MFLFLYVWTLLAAGVVTVASVRRRERAVVGEKLWTDLDRRARRTAVLLLAPIFAVAVAGRDELDLLRGLLTLVLVALVIAARPYPRDAVCGAGGVRAGWTVLPYEELAEWRLTGDHLRFRRDSLWRAVPLPAALHERLRRELEERAPDKESPFS